METYLRTCARFNKDVTSARINKEITWPSHIYGMRPHCRVKGPLVVSGHRVFMWTVSYFCWSGFTLLGFSFVLGFQANHKTQSKILRRIIEQYLVLSSNYTNPPRFLRCTPGKNNKSSEIQLRRSHFRFKFNNFLSLQSNFILIIRWPVFWWFYC